MNPSAAVDDMGAGVLQNVYITNPGDPLESGYTRITATFTGTIGDTVRLRFAEVDNQLYLNMGVDNVVLQRQGGGANLVINGGLESGLTGWTVWNNNLSNGSFYSQTGTASPLNGFTVPVPPGGSYAVMSDQEGAGARILYQDITLA